MHSSFLFHQIPSYSTQRQAYARCTVKGVFFAFHQIILSTLSADIHHVTAVSTPSQVPKGDAAFTTALLPDTLATSNTTKGAWAACSVVGRWQHTSGFISKQVAEQQGRHGWQSVDALWQEAACKGLLYAWDVQCQEHT
jgi:hypothetical protein